MESVVSPEQDSPWGARSPTARGSCTVCPWLRVTALYPRKNLCMEKDSRLSFFTPTVPHSLEENNLLPISTHIIWDITRYSVLSSLCCNRNKHNTEIYCHKILSVTRKTEEKWVCMWYSKEEKWCHDNLTPEGCQQSRHRLVTATLLFACCHPQPCSWGQRELCADTTWVTHGQCD